MWSFLSFRTIVQSKFIVVCYCLILNKHLKNALLRFPQMCSAAEDTIRAAAVIDTTDGVICSRKTVMSHINVYCVLLDFICFYYFWCVFMTSYPGTLGKMAVASVFLSALDPFWQDLCISMEIRKGHRWNNWLLHLHHDSWAHPISIQFNAWWIQPLSKKDTHSNQAYCHRSSPSIMVILVLTITKPSHIYQLVQSHWTVSVRERSDLWLSC